jgi:hypothetical protein
VTRWFPAAAREQPAVCMIVLSCEDTNREDRDRTIGGGGGAGDGPPMLLIKRHAFEI